MEPRSDGRIDMKGHLDQADFLEILYLGDSNEDRAGHLASCTACHDRFAELRQEIDADRSALDDRVTAKPDPFWNAQREEIVSKAISRNRGSFAFLRFRYAISIVLAVLLLGLGLAMIRTAHLNQIAQLPTDVARTTAAPADLFDDGDVRELDPWETDQLESFHQIVEWEEWLDEDGGSAVTSGEES